MKVRILYPTRAAMETRAVAPFDDKDRTAEVLRGPSFVCVLSGELAPLGHPSSPRSGDLATCERLFRATNAPAEFLDSADRELLRVLATQVRTVGASHTSMSVGDAIEIDGRLYVCAAFGFRRVA